MKDHRDVIIKPVVSEKSYALLDNGVYTFLVNPDANKIEIKQAVEDLFGVHVQDVKTMNIKGKTKRWGYRPYQRADWKKAIVTLKKGETIEFYEGV